MLFHPSIGFDDLKGKAGISKNCKQICRRIVVFMFIRLVHFLFCVVFTPVRDLFLAKREAKRHQSYSQSVLQADTNDFILVSLKSFN